MIYHEHPQRQVSYLQQCLSSDKIPLGVFLGAGCPMAVKTATEEATPLIPDIEGITKVVCDELSKDEECKTALDTVIRHIENESKPMVTVEDMLGHIRALRAVVGNDVVRGLSGKELDLLDQKISDSICTLVNQSLPNYETPYHELATWVDAIGRERAVEVFTTNYDLLIEQALEDRRVPYFDGFAGARKPFFDIQSIEADEELPTRWARLWKLHGSINWYKVEGIGVYRGAVNEKEAKRVIHPSHLKYEESRRMPYLAMMDRLRAFFKRAKSTLVICGYSFRDDHINEAIIQGLQNSPTSVAFALLFRDKNSYSQAVKLAHSRSNLTLLAKDGAIIGRRDIQWPEMQSDLAKSNSSNWIEWKTSDSTNEKGNLVAEFKLGDFAIFGKFLHELTDQVHHSSENLNEG